MFHHGNIIWAAVICQKVPCYMRYSAYRWFIVKKLKYFEVMLNIFEFSRVWENVGSWLIYANKFFWIAQPYFSTDITKGSTSFSFLLLRILMKKKFLIKCYCFIRYKFLYTSMKLKKTKLCYWHCSCKTLLSNQLRRI